MMRGRFITLEGVEGAGKSTQIRTLEAALAEAGIQAVTTREPGGNALAEAIRHILVNGGAMPPMTELLLMFAARSTHYLEHIKPALEAGQWVICDRFVDASYAYQGAGRGIDISHIEALQNMTLGDARPDWVLVFDLPVELGLQRAHNRPEQNRFDHESLAFMQRVRDCYLQRAAAEPGRYSVINAADELDAVTSAVQLAAKQFIQQQHAA